MESAITLSLREIKEGGIRTDGQVRASILLGDAALGSLRSNGPIAYTLQVQLYDEKELTAEAQLKVPLHVRCERCLNEFDYTLCVSCTVSLQVGPGQERVELTPALRDELMLALPTYPKCDLIGRECRINDAFGKIGLDKGPEIGVNCAALGGVGVRSAPDHVPSPPAE